MSIPEPTHHRVLVLAGAPFGGGTVHVARVANGLMQCGHEVCIASVAPSRVAAMVPTLTVDVLDPDASARTLRADVARLVEQVQPTVVLTDHDALRRVALRTVRPGTCVLHRVAPGDDPPDTTLLTRFAARRVHAGWLQPSLRSGPAVRTVSTSNLPAAFPLPYIAPNDSLADHASRAATVRGGALLVLPDPRDVAAAMPAVRTAAGLARLDATFRLVLLGAPTLLQPLRVLAAALRVAHAVEVRAAPPLEAVWPETGWPPVGPDDVIPAHAGDAPIALWAGANGDDGTTCALAAAQAGIPLLVASDHELAPTVRQHDAGLVMPVGSPQADALAASTLAALCAHHDERQRLREAARTLAATFDAASAVDRVLLAIQRLSTTPVS